MKAMSFSIVRLVLVLMPLLLMGQDSLNNNAEKTVGIALLMLGPVLFVASIFGLISNKKLEDTMRVRFVNVILGGMLLISLPLLLLIWPATSLILIAIAILVVKLIAPIVNYIIHDDSIKK